MNDPIEYIETENFRFGYWESPSVDSQNPPIVMVHGYPGRPQDFRFLFPYMKDFRCLALAMPKLDISTTKTDVSITTIVDRENAIMEFFSKKNTMSLVAMFELQKQIVNAKLILMRKMDTLSRIDTFVQTSKGYHVTGQEGYVAIDRMSGDAVKLVDRMEFSYNNFSPDIIKGWQSPSRN